MGKSWLSAGSGLIGTIYNIFAAERAWRKMAPSTKEQLKFQDELEDENAEDAYMRQREFQEDYLTPEKQIISQARGYEAIGMNKMALAGTTPGASASTSPQSSAGSASEPSPSSGAFGPIMEALGLEVQKDKINKDYDIQSQRIAVDRINAETARLQAEADAAYKKSLTSGQDITNGWLNDIYGADVADKNASAELKQVQQQHVLALVQSEYTRNELMKHEIDLIDEQKATQEYITAMSEAQSRYSDEYYKSLAKLTTANALLAQGEYNIFTHTLQKRKEAAMAELNHVIIKAGMDAEIFTGEGFKRHAAGKMTSAEKWQTGLQFGSTILSAGIHAAGGMGAAAIGAAGRAAGAAAGPKIIPGYAVDYQGYGYGAGSSNVPARFYGVPLQ